MKETWQANCGIFHVREPSIWQYTNKSLDIWDEGVQSTASAAKTAIDTKVVSMFT